VDTVLYEEELRESFLEYSMSVITSRALPDVRDGLKPVQRRVLYAMYREGHTHDSKYTKCAGIVGEVLKRFHPHGDASVYDTLVRLAQDWVLRYTLVDGQGNFGSIDGDSPAAYRYTEARLAALSGALLEDIRKNTVDFAPNYNNTDVEPLVFPARIPQLLINGSTGIAVGMATNIPPHNLDEVIQACVHVIDHPDAKAKNLLAFVKGPDFPTGGLILGKKDFKEAYLTGKGMVKMRGVVELEELGNGRQAIVISALPYNVNKARLIERIADLVKNRKIDGVQELRDESDKKGMRIFVGLKKGLLLI
jgi:DNA gyrase subunit A